MIGRALPMLLVTALLLGPVVAGAERKPEAPRQRANSPSETASCKAAVQRFYDWYVPRMLREIHVTAMEQAISIRPRDFSATLRQELFEDLAAAKKSTDEIVSLDFEPFVNSQDPAGRYVARKVTRVGQHYRVSVHSVVEGKVSEEPDVIPELVRWRGHWTFVNFHYPAVEGQKETNLLKLLKELKESRRQPSRRRR